jgi:malonyl CoA-acyl carrier protein transacylase
MAWPGQYLQWQETDPELAREPAIGQRVQQQQAMVATAEQQVTDEII